MLHWIVGGICHLTGLDPVSVWVLAIAAVVVAGRVAVEMDWVGPFSRRGSGRPGCSGCGGSGVIFEDRGMKQISVGQYVRDTRTRRCGCR